MEERVDKASRHADKFRELGLEQAIKVLIIARSKFEILFDLSAPLCELHEAKPHCLVAHFERVLLIGQTLFLLTPEFVQAVIVSIVVYELVVAFDTGLAYLLAYIDELFARLNNTRVDQLQLRRKGFYYRVSCGWEHRGDSN